MPFVWSFPQSYAYKKKKESFKQGQNKESQEFFSAATFSFCPTDRPKGEKEKESGDRVVTSLEFLFYRLETLTGAQIRNKNNGSAGCPGL